MEGARARQRLVREGSEMPGWAVRSAVWTARAALALWVTTIFFYRPGVNGSVTADFPDMIYGKAYRPYVTRVLFPAVVRGVVAATPAGVRRAIEQNPLTVRLASSWYVSRELKWRRNYLFEYLVSFALSALCLIGFSVVLERLWRCCFRPAHPFDAAVSLIGLLGLPPCFLYYSYLYDLPTLFLYTLCLWLLAARSWAWYLPAFALSSLSKETSILLAVVFAVNFRACRREDRRLYAALLAAQALIWTATRAAIAWAFRANPGGSLEFHLVNHNLRELSVPYAMAPALAWLLIAAAVLHRLGDKPRLLRLAVSMLAPLVGLCLLFGYVDELRDYYEVYAAALLLAAFSFLRWTGAAVETIAPTRLSDAGRLRAAAPDGGSA